jgi:hypothetical protein
VKRYRVLLSALSETSWEGYVEANDEDEAIHIAKAMSSDDDALWNIDDVGYSKDVCKVVELP